MRMSYVIVSAAAAALLATVASAEPAAPSKSFERDGMTYVYTVSTKGERTMINGRRFPDGKRFSLTVNNGRVSGVSGGMPVSFRVADATSEEIASR
jgi:hypothetical protein